MQKAILATYFFLEKNVILSTQAAPSLEYTFFNHSEPALRFIKKISRCRFGLSQYK